MAGPNLSDSWERLEFPLPACVQCGSQKHAPGPGGTGEEPHVDEGKVHAPLCHACRHEVAMVPVEPSKQQCCGPAGQS